MNGSFSGLLANCECCPRKCGANRLKGETGFCGAGAGIRVSHSGLHFGEEPPISGSGGSGTVFFWGCNLRCVFCQNHQISQGPWPEDGATMTADELAAEMIRLQREGAHNINFVSPSHMICQMADAIEMSREMGLSIPIVYNSNGYDSVESLRRIKGLVDIYLPDLKYMDNAAGKRFSAVEDYADTAPGAIEEMLDQVGLLEVDPAGVAVSGTLVRHLVLPGHLENSRKCLRVLAGLNPDIPVSVMSQYSPQHKASFHQEINRALSEDEYGEIVDYAVECGLENVFIQEMESRSELLPDFRRERPFDPPAPGAGS
jgi:putative pyruvate formate lyase activating enzyme